ncbi:MAG: hypothetical protein ACI868_001128, partial [Granulosicoccus sp.]
FFFLCSSGSRFFIGECHDSFLMLGLNNDILNLSNVSMPTNSITVNLKINFYCIKQSIFHVFLVFWPI